MQIGGGIPLPRVTSQIGKDGTGGAMNLIVLIGAIAVLAGAVVLVLRRLRSRQWDEAACHVTRCPSCDQKVRYFARNAGSAGLCPRCLKRLTLPKTPQPLPGARQPHRVGERLGALRRVY
jgi:hypothetical protein